MTIAANAPNEPLIETKSGTDALAGVPAVLLHIGAIDAAKLEAARTSGVPVSGIHTPLFLPEREPTLKTAIGAELAILLDLMNPS